MVIKKESALGGKTEIATFASGCFWCGEAVFRSLKGVKDVVPGYSGGKEEDADYEKVSSGNTGHVEAFQVVYNMDEISYSDLLDVFWATHDPTQEGGQGNDIGTQYRSVIFYKNGEQKKAAMKSKKELEKSKEFRGKIVTEIKPFVNFFAAEDYHRDYYGRNKKAPYCRLVISPKLDKLRKKFADKVNGL